MRKTIFTTVMLSLQIACNVGSAAAADDPLTLFKQGKLDEAIAAGELHVKQTPKDWASHALLSYLQWQSGNVQDAIIEGQRAIYGAPNNATPVTNLAHIYQSLGQYDEAIPLYEKAAKLERTNWVPQISLARSFFGKDDLTSGLRVLQQMATQSSEDFAWNYQLGLSYLTIDRSQDAIKPLEKAFALAPTSEQKSAARAQLLIAYLRESQNEKAKSLLPDYLASHDANGETFVRATNAFADPQIVSAAIATLTTPQDSEYFFRMGRSLYAQNSLALSEQCLKQAIELNPGLAKNHVALSAVLDKNADSKSVAQELDQAAMFDASDPVAKFLQAHDAGAPLLGVKFKASGLTCGCQSTRIDAAIRSLPGVALIGFEHKKPYEGTLFVDEKITSLEKVFADATAKTFPAGGESIPQGFNFAALKQEPIASISAAADLALSASYGSPVEFQHKFEPIAPSLPQASMLSSRSEGI